MADIEKLRTNYPKLKAMGIPDEAIIQHAKGKGYTDDEIASVLQATAEPMEATQQLTPTDTPNEGPPRQSVGNTEPTEIPSGSENNSLPNGVPSEGVAPVEHGTEVNGQDTNPMLTNQDVGNPTKSQENTAQIQPEPSQIEMEKFLPKDDETYQTIINKLIENKNNEDVVRNEAFESIVADLAQTLPYEDAEKKAAEIESEVMKNFNISRYIQNNIYEPESTLDTASRVEKYNVLQRKFNLSDEETKYWTEKWKEVAPSVLDSAANALDNFSIGAKQDWYGALALGAQLFGLGESEMAQNARAKIKELDAEATKINVERGSKFGAEDLSPVAILETAATAAIAASTLPASAVLASAAGLGAASGAIYAKGQGESDESVTASAVLGGALPLTLPAISKVARVMTESIKNFFNVEGLYKKDIAAYVEGLTAEEVIRASKFLTERKGQTTEIAWVEKNSPTWISAGVFRAVGLFLAGKDAEERIITKNNQAIVKGIEDTIKMLRESAPETLNTETGIKSIDFIADSLRQNITKAEKSLSKTIKASYDHIDSVAANVFAPNREQVLDDVAKGFKNFPTAYSGDKLDGYIEEVGKKVKQFDDLTAAQGGVTLKDLMDLQKSIKRDMPLSVSDAKLVVGQMNLHINQAKSSIITNALESIANKSADNLTPIDSLMFQKLTTLQTEIDKTNTAYKEKLRLFGQSKLKEFLDTEAGSARATEFVDTLIKDGKISVLQDLEKMYRLANVEKDFSLLGQRYVLNGIKKSINPADNTISTSAITFIDNLLSNKDLLTALKLPQKTYEHLLDLSRAFKAAQRMEEFWRLPHLSQNAFASKILYVFRNFMDLVRNVVTSKVYHGDELERLVREAKKLEQPTAEALKELNTNKLKHNAMKWNFIGMGANLKSNDGEQ